MVRIISTVFRNIEMRAKTASLMVDLAQAQEKLQLAAQVSQKAIEVKRAGLDRIEF